jgi:hypothetical protein
MVQLNSMFAFPVRPASWQRPPGDHSYRVTNPFTGVDLINGGLHRAVDLGNFRTNDPLRSPAGCQAKGRRHFDGAIGVDLLLYPNVVVTLWHLREHLLGTDWRNVSRGQLIGYTGNSGRQPMPAHTHVELWRGNTRFDPEPYLLGMPLLEDGTDMQVLQIITEDWHTRTGPDEGWFLDAARNRKYFNARVRVTTVAEVLYNASNYRLVSFGQGEPLLMPRANLEPIPGTRVVGPRIAADCTQQEQKLAAIRKAGGW